MRQGPGRGDRVGLDRRGRGGSAEPPAGAASCSGCHPASPRVTSPVPRLAGRRRAAIVRAMQDFRSGTARRHRDGPDRQGLHRRRDPGARGLVRGAESDGHAGAQFLQLGAAATAARRAPARARVRAGAPPRVVVVGGGFAGASCARALRRPTPRIAVTLVEPNATFTACPFSNAVIGGPARADRAAVHATSASPPTASRSTRGIATGVDPHARSVTLADGARLPYDRLVLAPGIDIRWGALPGYDEAAAAQMPHAWRAGEQTAAAAPPARGHGRRRPRRDLGAGQSVPLPARPLRARQPDRALPEDEEAAVEADRARRQGRVLQAAAVPGRVGRALPGPARVGAAVEGRQRHLGRRRDPHARDRLRPAQGRRWPTSSRRRRRGASPRRRASPTAPAGARSIR